MLRRRLRRRLPGDHDVSRRVELDAVDALLLVGVIMLVTSSALVSIAQHAPRCAVPARAEQAVLSGDVVKMLVALQDLSGYRPSR